MVAGAGVGVGELVHCRHDYVSGPLDDQSFWVTMTR